MAGLEGKTILVSGGSSGLGAAIVKAVRGAGGRALVIDRQAPLADVPHALVDLAEPRKAEAAIKKLIDDGPLDGVVTSAAMDQPADFIEVEGELWDRIVTVNLLGTAAVLRASLPALVKTRGRIVTVASTLGLRALPAATAYCASKFGVVGLTRALMLELAGKVGVTMLVPGGMKTSFFDGRDPRFKPAPDQLLNDPDDVARAVLFALEQPGHCELRELVVTPAVEPSWP